MLARDIQATVVEIHPDLLTHLFLPAPRYRYHMHRSRKILFCPELYENQL